jgi:Uma2 family endonuclease
LDLAHGAAEWLHFFRGGRSLAGVPDLGQAGRVMALAYDMPSPPRDEPLRRPPPEERWRRPIADLGAPIAPSGGLESHEPPMESFVHLQTMLLLLETLLWLWRDRDDFFAAGNLTVYYSPSQLKSEDFRGPDFFVVLGTHREPARKSWVVWDEGGKYPNVIVEALSESTASNDRVTKKQIYQDVFRTPEYFLFDPESLEFIGYRLQAGKYEPIAPDAAGRLRSDQLDLSLGVHEGRLRFFLPTGEIVPTGIERGLKAEAEAQRAESAEQRAESAEQRAESAEQRAESAEQRVRALAEKLRALGVDPDGVA